MKLAIAMASICLLGGCVVRTTGAFPAPGKAMTITAEGNAFWLTMDSLKREAIKGATAVCAKDWKTFKFIESKESPAGVSAQWPKSEVLFTCE